MKHSLLFLSLLSLLFLGSCASDDALTEQMPDPEPDVPTIPFTGTITTGNGPSAVAQALVADDGPFHALSDEGTTLKATWEVGDELALIVNGTLCKATVSEVNGSKANISAAVPATVSDGAEARLIYPYTAVDESTLEVKTDLLSEQDGSLATIAKNLDVCKGSGTLSVANNTAKLKADVTMAEQYCIWRLATQYKGSALSITKLTIVQGSDSYTVNLSSAASSGIYVALKPAAAKALAFQAFPANGARYLKDYASVTLAAQKFYRSTLNLDFDEFWFIGTLYMWDAKEWYWYGIETFPINDEENSDAYPRSATTDPDRWYNEIVCPVNASNPEQYNATRSCKDMPNVNEMAWYFELGDVHYDRNVIWWYYGQQQKGGCWIKKKAVILAENTSNPNVFNRNKSIDGTDWRIKQGSCAWNVIDGCPSNTSDYFFIPNMGHCLDGRISRQSYGGTSVWTSSPHPYTSENSSSSPYTAYFIYFDAYECNLNSTVQINRTSGQLAGHRPDGSNWFK